MDRRGWGPVIDRDFLYDVKLPRQKLAKNGARFRSDRARKFFSFCKRREAGSSPLGRKTLLAGQLLDEARLKNIAAALASVRRKQQWMGQSSIPQDCLF